MRLTRKIPAKGLIASTSRMDAAELYCEAMTCLARDLASVDLQSRGFLALCAYVANYANSNLFASLMGETKQLQADLSAIHYCLLIRGSTIRVRKYDAESDYSADIEETFAKFRQGDVKDYRVKFRVWPDMDHVEAQILELVAHLHPDIFSHLDDYCIRNGHFLDKTITTFDREIQFYVAYLEHIARFKRAGLHFCYPHMSSTSKEVHDYAAFDLALAHKLLNENSSVVCNDFSLAGKERIIVVTGPNQGGKTTFTRTFGQVHYLASIGCPVPGREPRRRGPARRER